MLDVWPGRVRVGRARGAQGHRPGERRPVVVCQHGRNGVPRDTIDGNMPPTTISGRRWPSAASSSSRRTICIAARTATAGSAARPTRSSATLFSFIIAQHDQILRWLGTLPFVDADRIAFYGLSYGGETAVRVPAILEKYASRFAPAISTSGRARSPRPTSPSASCARSSGRCRIGTGATPSTMPR